MAFLPQLRCLTELGLSARDREANVWMMTDDTILSSFDCPTLRSLYLEAPFTSVHLASLLPRLPLLTQLTLCGRLELESLAFFSQCADAQRGVASLSLSSYHRWKSPVRELVHLFHLRSLADLTLEQSFVETLDAFTRAVFTPPSPACPSLVRFSVSHDSAAVNEEQQGDEEQHGNADEQQ